MKKEVRHPVNKKLGRFCFQTTKLFKDKNNLFYDVFVVVSLMSFLASALWRHFQYVI